MMGKGTKYICYITHKILTSRHTEVPSRPEKVD